MNSIKMIKIMNLSGITLLFALILTVSASKLKALRAGSIQITDADLRAEKIIHRDVHIHLKKSYYESKIGIDVIAAITSFTMDDQLNFYFKYNIVCPEEDCVLNFTLVRHTEQVNPNFKYSLTIDYLIGSGFKVMYLNMSSYQEHLMMSDIISYDDEGKRQNLASHLPYNNKDAMRVLLFPNGWSNLTKTGKVLHNYVMTTQMYVVHYMDPERYTEFQAMGWPEGKDYINYKILFFDADYEPAYQCQTEDKFNLYEHYEKICGGGGDLKWFFSFKRTNETQFQGEFFQLRSGYSFSVSKTPSEYGLLGFPFIATDQFVERRTHEYKFTREYLMIGEVAGMLIATGLLAGAAFLSYKYISRIIHKKKFNRVTLHMDDGTGREHRAEGSSTSGQNGEI